MMKAVFGMILVVHFVSRLGVFGVLLVQQPTAPRGSQESSMSPHEHSFQSTTVPDLRRDILAYLRNWQTNRKRSAELVDGDWFQNSPPVSFEKRMTKSKENSKESATTHRRQVHRSNRPLSPSLFWNRLPTLGDDLAEIVTKPGPKIDDISTKVMPKAFPNKPDYERQLVLSNVLPEESDTEVTHDEPQTDVIQLLLPVHSSMAEKALKSDPDSSVIRESTLMTALLRTIWHARQVALNRGYNDPANAAPGTGFYGRVFQGQRKRAYIPYEREEMFQKRPFDSLANGLIGKRSAIPKGLLFRKRPFDTLPNGLIGKRGGPGQSIPVNSVHPVGSFAIGHGTKEGAQAALPYNEERRRPQYEH